MNGSTEKGRAPFYVAGTYAKTSSAISGSDSTLIMLLTYDDLQSGITPATRNVCVGDLVILQEDGLVPGKWSLARVLQTHPGKDGLVRVVTIKTSNGIYKRPVVKVAVLIPAEN